jgi:hypothetical protein
VQAPLRVLPCDAVRQLLNAVVHRRYERPRLDLTAVLDVLMDAVASAKSLGSRASIAHEQPPLRRLHYGRPNGLDSAHFPHERLPDVGQDRHSEAVRPARAPFPLPAPVHLPSWRRRTTTVHTRRRGTWPANTVSDSGKLTAPLRREIVVFDPTSSSWPFIGLLFILQQCSNANTSLDEIGAIAYRLWVATNAKNPRGGS